MPQKPPGDQITIRGSFNALVAFCGIHARCVTPFLRTGVGSASQGLFTFIAGAVIFFAAVANKDEPLLIFWFWWLALSIRQWVKARGTGNVIHSRYDGAPVVGMLFIKDEGEARRWVEPLLCLLVGCGLTYCSDILGKLVMSAGFSLSFLENYYRHVTQRREQDVIDARIESETLVEGVRNRINRVHNN